MPSPDDWNPQPKGKMSYQELQEELALTRQDSDALMQEIEYYKRALADDPWRANPHKTPQAEFADRLLRHRMPEDQKPSSDELWFTRSEMIELLALIPSLSTRDRNRFVRDWEDIETLSQGDGNQQIVRSRQERLLFEIQIARSVGATAIPGMTTTTALLTSRMESEQKISSPQVMKKPQGFLDGLLNRGGV